MKVRGRRECQDCGTVWSYYETGSVTCPDCGSMRSVGVDDRTRHTDAAADLDLSRYRSAVADGDVSDVADDLKADLREYVRKRGFVDAGQLRPIDDAFLAARELLQVTDVVARSRTRGRGGGVRELDADVELYLLDLLRGADAGERPDPEAVPDSMAAARGLGYAEAIDDYRGELAAWLDDYPDPEARVTLGSIRDRVKRVQALEGDVPVEDSETLVLAARELGAYVRDGDEGALATARDRLSRLD